MIKNLNFLILDVYPNDNWRIVKDTAGGYGTGNNFGHNFLGRLMNFFVSKLITMPPMFAIYVNSIIKNKGSNVEYSKKIPNENEIKKYDYIIMPSSIIAHETEISVIRKLSDLNAKIFVIGIFANVKKTSYQFKNSYVVSGEPESFFIENNLNKENLDKFFNSKNNNTYFGKPFVNNLDDLPFPNWDDYLNKYPLKNNFLGFNNKTAIPIVATRGCPYSCFNYCTYPLQQGRKVRFRSVKNVLDEIIKRQKELGVTKFIFRDPVFSIKREYTVELCEAIIKLNFKIEFLIETHLANLDDELIDLLYKAGLRFIYVGIESVDGKVLNNMKRHTTNKDYQYSIITKLEKKGISVKSMFMLGNPEDDENSMMDTIKYSSLLPNKFVQFSVFTPYPGTPIFKEFENKINTTKMEDFNQYNLVFEHKFINNKILKKYKHIAYKNFYINLNNLGTIIKSVTSVFR